MILDSSFIVALFLDEDYLHSEAMKLLEEHKGKNLIIPDRVLEETFTVCTYKRGIKFALEMLGKLTKIKVLVL